MARGGKREGAGRKPGSVTKKTREIADKAIEEGITPLEVMLDNMRVAFSSAQEQERTALAADDGDAKDGLATVAASFRRIAQDCAKDAAPYVHPRLASVEHSGKKGSPIELLLAEIDGSTRGLPKSEK